MQAFSYARPANLTALLALLNESSDDKLLAGGQSLLASMKMGLMLPQRLIDLQAIAELQGIHLHSNTLHIGAMSTHATIANSLLVRSFASEICDLAGHIADAQIRNRGTIGGSLANYDPAACWPAGILALNAVLHTPTRSITADDFFIDLFTTSLESKEVLTGVSFTKPSHFAYVKFEQPASRFALVGVAVAQFENKGTHTVRVAVTGTSQGVLRLPTFEAVLSRNFSAAAIANLTVDEAIMGSDIHAQADYRAHLAAVGVRRAVAQCLNTNERK